MRIIEVKERTPRLIQLLLPGFNDLKTANPNLASEWNYQQNGDLNPEDFTANSGRKVWWICDKGHEWQATISSRNSGRGCPKCAGKKRWETRRHFEKESER